MAARGLPVDSDNLLQGFHHADSHHSTYFFSNIQFQRALLQLESKSSHILRIKELSIRNLTSENA